MAATISIDLDEGYWPHIVEKFFDRYGAESLFVRSVADCLTARHVRVLIKAGKIEASEQPVQVGDRETLEALEALLERLKADGAKEHLLHILRESMGVKEPGVLEAEVDGLYGRGAFSRWLVLFEFRKFDEASEVLRVVH